MTKKEIYEFQKQLDREKHELVDTGIAFSFAIREGSENFHVGAGSAEDMTIILLAQLCSLYIFGVQDKKRVTPEEFAEDVKQNLLKYMKAHI